MLVYLSLSLLLLLLLLLLVIVGSLHRYHYLVIIIIITSFIAVVIIVVIGVGTAIASTSLSRKPFGPITPSILTIEGQVWLTCLFCIDSKHDMVFGTYLNHFGISTDKILNTFLETHSVSFVEGHTSSIQIHAPVDISTRSSIVDYPCPHWMHIYNTPDGNKSISVYPQYRSKSGSTLRRVNLIKMVIVISSYVLMN